MRKNLISSIQCLFLLSIAILTLTACGRNNYEELAEDTALLTPSTLDELLDRALGRRENIIKPDYHAIAQLFEGQTTDPFIYNIWEQRGSAHVTGEEALEDIEVFFEAMRIMYPGWIYFGGDEMFLPIKDLAMADVASMQGVISTNAIGQILYRHLSPIINDRHFWIGQNRLGREVFFSHITGLEYDRTTNGFRNRETGRILTYIDGHDIEEVMQLYINSEGETFYRPIFIGDVVLVESIAFTYSDNSVEHRRFSMHRASSPSFTRLPSLTHQYGIPIVDVYVFGFDGDENSLGIEHALPFLSFAEELRNEPTLIIDLRSHMGGNLFMPFRWLYTLIGEIATTNFVNLSIIPYTAYVPEIEFNFQDNPAIIEYFQNTGLFDYSTFGENIIINHYSGNKITENDQIIIILTDRHTLSAAEAFVDATMNINNTLVIGSPTMGMLKFGGAVAPTFLPNSGLTFGFSQSVFLWPEGHFYEGRGILPDVWVEGDALIAALALLRNAGFGY